MNQIVSNYPNADQLTYINRIAIINLRFLRFTIRQYFQYSVIRQGNDLDYNPTVEQLKQWAEEEKDKIDIEKCILAYQIKDGKLIDLKK